VTEPDQKKSLPEIVLSTPEQYQAALNEIEILSEAPAGSKEAYLRDALQAAVDQWWNARRRQAH
jgi:hypothetical protein